MLCRDDILGQTTISSPNGRYTSALAVKNNQVNLLFLARLFVYSQKKMQ